MAQKYLFDACALIAYLNDEEGSGKIEELLKNDKQNIACLYIHEINLLEIYYGIYRDEGKDLAEDVFNKLILLPVNIISGLKQMVFKESGRLKATYKVSLADSIALAEAKVNKMPLVTCDHHEFDIVEKANELEFHWIR